MSRGFGSSVAMLLAAALFLPGRAVAMLSIHPAYVEFDLDRGRPSETITVTNLTDEETRYRAKILHFLYTKDGGVQEVPPDEHSLAQWIKLNPKEFTLPPKGSRVIRLSVIPPDHLAPGEYWAAIEFDPLAGQVSETDDGQGRTIRLHVTASIIVPIVGQVGEVVYGAELRGLQAWKTHSGVEIHADLVNTGTARIGLSGTCEILDASGAVVAEGLIGEDTVLAGGERIFTQTLKGDYPEDEYTVRVRYISKRIEETLAGQTQVALTAPEPAPTQP
jgi:fimbrial chaperone protein